MRWIIRPLLGGEFGMIRDDIKFQGGDPSVQGMVPSLLFLLQDEHGSQAVVDTSFRDVEEVRAMGLVAKRERPLRELLARAGVRPQKVEALLLTHTHWDHAGNCGLFPNARIYCQERDWEYAFRPENGYTQNLRDSLWRIQDRVVPLNGDSKILPGIRAICFGGHTPGSQAFFVDTDQGPTLVCGDDIMTFRNVEDHIPVGLCVRPEGCRQALEYARNGRLAYLLPSHDYRSLEYTADMERCRLNGRS